MLAATEVERYERLPWSVLLKKGLRAAWPICIGYIPLGMALGVLAQNAGIHPLATGLMSLLVFAGSAQFIGVSLLAGNAFWLSIVATTFVVNLRHVLMSSSLSVYLRGKSSPFLALFSFGVTDESFAVNMARFRDGCWHPHQALVVNLATYSVWVASTIIGGYGGQFIQPGSFGIDYALSAMFLCLLVFQLRGRIYIITALLSGGIAILTSTLIPGNAYVMIASLLAATAGFVIRRRFSGKGTGHDQS
jgi:4-azaleucine resistance transporter AzlC